MSVVDVVVVVVLCVVPAEVVSLCAVDVAAFCERRIVTSNIATNAPAMNMATTHWIYVLIGLNGNEIQYIS